MGENAVLAENVTHVFRSGFLGRRRVTALLGLDLAVRTGEILALLGPNGSGKTTFLKILLGLLKPTRGRVAILGNPPGTAETLRRIGYMAEQPAFLDLLTGRETLHFAGRMFGIGRKERSARVEQLLDRVDLAPDGDRPVGEYSQGMRKRIALAQSLINDPELLLLDEPTASLDPASAERVQEIVREKARAGRTVVLSSHLLGRVEEVATRVCIVYRGREARTGTLEEVAGIPGALDVRVRGASPEDLGRLFEGAGIEMESCGPASRPLREVFLRLTSPGDEETTPSGAEDGGREEEEGP